MTPRTATDTAIAARTRGCGPPAGTSANRSSAPTAAAATSATQANATTTAATTRAQPAAEREGGEGEAERRQQPGDRDRTSNPGRASAARAVIVTDAASTAVARINSSPCRWHRRGDSDLVRRVDARTERHGDAGDGQQRRHDEEQEEGEVRVASGRAVRRDRPRSRARPTRRRATMRGATVVAANSRAMWSGHAEAQKRSLHDAQGRGASIASTTPVPCPVERSDGDRRASAPRDSDRT